MGEHWRHRLARLLGKILGRSPQKRKDEMMLGGHRQMRLNPVQEGAELGCLGRRLEDGW